MTFKTNGSKANRFDKAPYKPWDGNQATCLVYPAFFAFVLVLISYLSSPIIPGLSIVNITTIGNGTFSIGSWGWCAHNLPNVNGTLCSPHKAFSTSVQTQLDTLPTAFASLLDDSSALPRSYIVAETIFHLFACIATWITLMWTAFSSWQWGRKHEKAWVWTRWAFAGTLWSSICILIPWALDLASIKRIGRALVDSDGSHASVKPGPCIWMMMVAWIFMSAMFIIRTTWLKYRPQPHWAVEGGDFLIHVHGVPPLGTFSQSLALTQDPPAWESLDIHTPRVNLCEKEC